jgi:membrane protease YdiL (CAAX protease family)
MSDLPSSRRSSLLPPFEPSQAGRRQLRAEIAVVVAVFVLPHLYNAIAALLHPETLPAENAFGHLHLFISSIPAIAIVWWMIARSSRPMSEFGVVRPHLPADALLGLAIAALSWAAAYASSLILSFACAVVPFAWDVLCAVPAPATLPFEAPAGHTVVAIFVVGLLANALAEEAVLRAYLIPRVHAATGSAWVAVLLSSALGASYHIYQGSYAAWVVLLVECVCGALFLRLRRLWPFALGHFGYDLVMVFW